jgi:hypothetical protein
MKKDERVSICERDWCLAIRGPYVAFITGVPADHLGWPRARLRYMTRFTMALSQRRSADLRPIALTFTAGVKSGIHLHSALR